MNLPLPNTKKTTRTWGPGVPVDESARLVALRNLPLLDTPAEESFDRVTRLVAKALRVPIVLVSLVDETRQWFKSRVGLEISQTPREMSFCAHAVFERCPVLVRDATLDGRFSANPLVMGDPHIRAYLGIPIYTHDGQPIGALCAIDQKPRDFSEDDIATVREFAHILQETIHAKELAARTDGVLHMTTEQAAPFRETFERAAVGIVHTAPSGDFLHINRQACVMLGYTPEELVAVSFIDITHPDDVPKNTELFHQAWAGTIDAYRIEKRLLRKDGGYLWVDVSVAVIRSVDGRPDYMIAVMIDISAQKLAEAELERSRDGLQTEIASQTRRLRERNDALRMNIKQVFESARAQRQAEHRLRSIANSMPAMIGYWNAELRCEFANAAHREWFGLTPDQIVGLTMPELIGEAAFKLNAPHARLALAGHAQHFERHNMKVDGTPSFTDARYLPDITQEGKVRGFYVLETDVTALRETQIALEAVNSKLTRDSTLDYLTGLSNRRVFSERSAGAFDRFKSDAEVYGLILLDVDDFKQINDHFGHQVGDEVLGALGNVLRNALRGRNDVVARLGGEEFAVLCFGDLDCDLLLRLAERIRAQINKEIVDSAKGPVRFASSFGIALSLAEDTEWTHIYARADSALYDAKAAGKNRVVYRKSCTKGATGRFRSIRCEPNGY